MSTVTRSAMCMSIDGFMRNNKYPRGYNIFQDDDGSEMSAPAALRFLTLEKEKGRNLMPMDSECGSPCGHASKGCVGFDYVKSGCPGYKIEQVMAWKESGNV